MAPDDREVGGESTNGVEYAGVVEDVGVGGGSERTACAFVKLRLEAEGRERGPWPRTKRRRQRLQSIIKSFCLNGQVGGFECGGIGGKERGLREEVLFRSGIGIFANCSMKLA